MKHCKHATPGPWIATQGGCGGSGGGPTYTYWNISVIDNRAGTYSIDDKGKPILTGIKKNIASFHSINPKEAQQNAELVCELVNKFFWSAEKI